MPGCRSAARLPDGAGPASREQTARAGRPIRIQPLQRFGEGRQVFLDQLAGYVRIGPAFPTKCRSAAVQLGRSASRRHRHRYRGRPRGFSSSKNDPSFTPRAFPVCHKVTTVGLRWPNSRPLTYARSTPMRSEARPAKGRPRFVVASRSVPPAAARLRAWTQWGRACN